MVKPFMIMVVHATEVLSCAFDPSHVRKVTRRSALTSKHSIIGRIVNGFAKYVC